MKLIVVLYGYGTNVRRNTAAWFCVVYSKIEFFSKRAEISMNIKLNRLIEQSDNRGVNCDLPPRLLKILAD